MKAGEPKKTLLFICLLFSFLSCTIEKPNGRKESVNDPALPEIETPFELQKSVPRLKKNYPVEDFLFNAVHQTAVSGKLPAAFTFNSNNFLETNIGKVLLPVNLIWGLLASVIFHPANKSETIADKYWFRIADFKMFISELWGRRDLAERIIKFYLERKDD